MGPQRGRRSLTLAGSPMKKARLPFRGAGFFVSELRVQSVSPNLVRNNCWISAEASLASSPLKTMVSSAP